MHKTLLSGPTSSLCLLGSKILKSCTIENHTISMTFDTHEKYDNSLKPGKFCSKFEDYLNFIQQQFDKGVGWGCCGTRKREIEEERQREKGE